MKRERRQREGASERERERRWGGGGGGEGGGWADLALVEARGLRSDGMQLPVTSTRWLNDYFDKNFASLRFDSLYFAVFLSSKNTAK